MSGKTFTVRRGMTPVPNETIYATFQAIPDKDGEPSRLSIQALGLLLLALSRPSGKSSMGYRAFLGRGLGRDALLKANRELTAAGLRHQFKRRGPGGSIITDTVISEVPISPEEAETEWLEHVRSELKGSPEPVDNSPSDRAPISGATGPKGGGTVRRFTGARSTGASLSRESAKLSSTTYSESGEINAGADSGHHEEPGDQVNDATSKPVLDLDGEGFRKYQEFKAAQRRSRAAAVGSPSRDQKEVAPLRPMPDAAARVGSLS